MKVVSSQHLPDSWNPVVLTIGNFDGVHVGHRTLVAKVIQKAKELKLASGVLTFEPHPMQVLHSGREFRRIFPAEDRKSVLESLGVDILAQEPFSRDLSEKSPEWFVEELVIRRLKAQFVYVGFDFNFGKDRSGTPEKLVELCLKKGVGAEVVGPVEMEGDVISSSRIRKLIQAGKVELADKLLGRPFYLKGVVEKGDGRGRKIGFPTANIFTTTDLFPKMGVYFTRAHLKGQTALSLTNVGQNPTFDSARRHPIQVETHLLDFDKDIYGEVLRVDFLKYQREEQKFPSVEKLVEQIGLDVNAARSFFKTLEGAE